MLKEIIYFEKTTINEHFPMQINEKFLFITQSHIDTCSYQSRQSRGNSDVDDWQVGSYPVWQRDLSRIMRQGHVARYVCGPNQVPEEDQCQHQERDLWFKFDEPG